jgi:hypothetical protein
MASAYSLSLDAPGGGPVAVVAAAAVAPQSALAPAGGAGAAAAAAAVPCLPLGPSGLATLRDFCNLLLSVCQLLWVALRAGVARAALRLLLLVQASRAAAPRALHAGRPAAAAPPPPPDAGPAAGPAPLLGPQLPCHAGRLTVVLDLDETLIAPPRSPRSPHRSRSPTPDGGTPPPSPPGDAVPRPGVRAFLSRLAEATELVLWTAAGPAYAARQLRCLDPDSALFAGVVCGGAAVGAGGAKDLSRLQRDLGRVVLVDNAVSAMALQPSNGIPCPPFRGAADDRVLEQVMLPLLLSLAELPGDVRPVLESKIGLSKWMEARQAGRRASEPGTPRA